MTVTTGGQFVGQLRITRFAKSTFADTGIVHYPGGSIPGIGNVLVCARLEQWDGAKWVDVCEVMP